MSREHTSRREILEAIRGIPSMVDLLSMEEGHFLHELDLEVIVYGRNYNGKKVGPYVRLLTFEPGETIVRKGDWGGNTYYIVIEGKASVTDTGAPGGKTGTLPAGLQFGEMSILAGVPRSVTVKAPDDQPVQILEIQRPAIRLLRKLPKVSEIMDRSYRTYAKKQALDDLKISTELPEAMAAYVEKISSLRVYSKNHLLCQEGLRIDSIYFIRDGWLRRSKERTDGPNPGKCPRCESTREKGLLFCTTCGEKLFHEDYLGRGFCFGLEGIKSLETWPTTVTVMGRTEVWQIPFVKLGDNLALREALAKKMEPFAPRPIAPPAKREDSEKVAQERLISTGLVDGTNLLVMDMDLCVRCGNCSLACHKVHGQSRLLREGIHVNRLLAGRRQSLLSPAVCMHCKDPECLTGCPTGAIGRFDNGQIDITAKTCIGCGDCASQCPYDAISLVPRKPAPSAGPLKMKEKILELLRIRLDPLPSPFKETEDLVAVKCNLCQGTPLNPSGRKTEVYSCEMSCPTGALTRISPTRYFTEIGRIEGLTVLDRTHAVGRNIHVSDPPKRLLHLAGIVLTLFLTAATILGIQTFGLGERLAGFLNMRWLTGIVGLMAIAGAMAYPFRRQVYTRRRAPLRYWMIAHSYAGLIAAILIVLHGGSDSGGILTTALMWSFDLVVLTGLFGIFCYVAAPRLLTRIEGAPLLLDSLLERRTELRKKISEISATGSKTLQDSIRKKVLPRFISLGYLLRQYLKREDITNLVNSAKREFSQTGMSAEEQTALEEAVESASTLRRIDALILLHRILKLWLVPHVVSTSLMLALMVIHIVQVIYFAWR